MIDSVFCKNGRQNILQDLKHIVLAGKCHLHIELIKLSRRPVRTRILVAETRRDLEITVKPRSHQQLLELLGRLRQRVKFSRMVSRRHEIVARALRGGARQDRRRDLHEIMTDHRRTQICDDLAPEHDLCLYIRISQIQITVFQSGILVRLPGMIDLERQLIIPALSQDSDLRRHDLDITGLHPGILGAALAHCPHDLQRRLVVDSAKLIHDLLRLDNDLRLSIEIPQDQKTQIPADLAQIVIPADKFYFLTNILQPQLITIVCTSLHP